MFMAAKQQTPGSINTGKLVYQTYVNKADIYLLTSISNRTWSSMIVFCLFLLTETSQLLLIVSDGRGLFLEGKERVAAAVQAARSANIFVIFVVLDNPNSRVRNSFGSKSSLAEVKKIYKLIGHLLLVKKKNTLNRTDPFLF